jgi:arginase
MGDWALLGVPLYTLAGYKGMGAAPSALRKAGLGRALGNPIDKGNVELPPLKKDVAEGKVKNLSHFRDATSRIYDAVRSVQAEQVFILGGECSVTVGTLAGLAEAFSGKPGMLWMDAHGDFNTPETSPSGYIGGMCLAMTCGRSKGLGLELGAPEHLLGEERLVHVGSRALDPPEVAAFNASPAKLYTAQQVKKTGAADVAEEAARHLSNRSDWIVCHLDVDIVDPELIPSVNYPTPGGLTLEETELIIRTLLKTEKMRVLEIAAYNASKDTHNSSARKIVDLMEAVFS